MKIEQISKLLSDDLQNVLAFLMQNRNWKYIGKQIVMGNTSGEPGESLKIENAGEKKGLWHDFSTGEGGDLIELWRLKRDLSISETIKECKQYLGIGGPSFAPHRANSYSSPICDIESFDINNSPIVFDYLSRERMISKKTLDEYSISSSGRYIVFPYIRDEKLIQLKKISIDRDNGKKKIFVEKNCEPCLFGWDTIPADARRITITEGEIDAMTLHQYGFPALSVPFGGGGGKKQQWIENDFDRLDQFTTIILCFDQDESGEEAVKTISERLGHHRCVIAELPFKDANDCLKNGVTEAQMTEIINNAKSFDPAELRSAKSFSDAVINQFYPAEGEEDGYVSPWSKTHNNIRFNPSELSLWTGINGHGKSQMLGHVMLSHMKQGARVCIASLELKPEKLLMRLARQAGAQEMPTQEYIKAIHNWYQDKLWIFNIVGTTKSDRLLEVFLYARQRYGIDVFVIDSFMKCGIAEDDYKAQKAFVDKLCDFKNEHNCHIHLISHPRKGADENSPPGKMDIKGTGAVSDLADNCFTVWRNKSKEAAIQIAQMTGEIESDLSEKYDALWICDKSRNGEWEGNVALWFDKKTFQYLENMHVKPKPFVHYSKFDY